MTSVEVLKGLTVGEKVIVDQLDRFRDGDSVRAVVADQGESE
jgi:hypothetical protein